MNVLGSDFFIQPGSTEGRDLTLLRPLGGDDYLLISTIDRAIITELEGCVCDQETSLGDLFKRIVALNLPKCAFSLIAYRPSKGQLEHVAYAHPPFYIINSASQVVKLSNDQSSSHMDDDVEIETFPSEELRQLLVGNKKQEMNLLEKQFLSFFSRKQIEVYLENEGGRLRSGRIPFGFILLNRRLGHEVRFSLSEELPATQGSIINFEKKLERVLENLFIHEDVTNSKTMTVFNELIINSYEHGALQIDGATKQEHLKNGTYDEYVLEQELLKEETLQLQLTLSDTNTLMLSIEDNGQGFDFGAKCKALHQSKGQAIFHGRGLSMVDGLCDGLFYDKDGCKVTFFMSYPHEERTETNPVDLLYNEITVLYVEDEELIRSHFSNILRRLVKTYYIAEDGEQGLELFRKHRPEIIITDVNMPNKDGLQMAKEIKAIDNDTQIVVTTAYSEGNFLMRAIDVGIDKYLIKPVEIDRLKKVLYEMAKNVYFKREAIKARREVDRSNQLTMMDLRSRHHYTQAQQRDAFAKEELIITDDSNTLEHLKAELYYRPLELLSGDIYGVVKVDEHHTLAYIVDSMGKGLTASVTAILSAAFINRSISQAAKFNNLDFDRLLNDYTAYITNYLLEDECVSFTFVHLDTQTNHFQYAAFGMYPILIQHDSTIDEYPSNNPPFMRYSPPPRASERITLPECFELVFYSDGIVETEEFTQTDLQNTLQGDQPFVESVKEYFANTQPDDDITLISVKRT